MRDENHKRAIEFICNLQADRFFLEFLPAGEINELLGFVKEYMENSIPMEFLEKWFGDNYHALTDLEMEWRRKMTEMLAKIIQLIEESQKKEKQCMNCADVLGQKYYEGVQDGLLKIMAIIRKGADK